MSPPAELLAHRDDVVIAAFMARWEIERAQAEALFEDAMAWLWAASRPGAPTLSIEPAMRIVDEMWHELVLHTARYAALCQRWFGRFVHHLPEGDASAPGSTVAPFDAAAAETQWRYFAAELGVDRLLRWYVELPLRHDDAWFRSARRPPPDTGYRPSARMIERWRQRTGGDGA